MRQFIFNITFILALLSCQKLEIKRVTKILTYEPEINGTIVTLKGNLMDIAGEGVDQYGYCYKESDDGTPTINDSVLNILDNISKGDFEANPRGLLFDHNYICCAFAKNSDNQVYGSVYDFIITNYTNIDLSFQTVDFPTQNKLNLSNEIRNVGSLLIEEYGHCWIYSPTNAWIPNPTINDNKTLYTNLTNDTIFNLYIPNLEQNQTLYVRPYFKLTGNVIVYGDIFSRYISTAYVSTNNYYISGNNAILVGTIDLIGVLDIVDHGHCWSTGNPSPLISNSNTTNLGPINYETDFNSTISLIQGNTYYYRSYLTDASGDTYYGLTNSFTF